MSRHALERLSERFPQAVITTYTARGGDDVAVIRAESITDVCRFAKEAPEMNFKLLLSITTVDRLLLPESEPRFELVYFLRCLDRGDKVLLKARVSADRPELPTVMGVFRGADWWERMAWDLYGIRFTGRPDLKRIYLYEEFVGHPLRKDYPLRGRQPLIPERAVRVVDRGPGAAKPE
jgi:NADH-quinone oxidoreductase subunit C